MTNVEKLELHAPMKLGGIRQRLGADDGSSKEFDEQINQMAPETLVSLWTGWDIGNEDYGREILYLYNVLTKGD